MPVVVDPGTTGYTATLFFLDPAQTDGSGKTGLVAADLTMSYVRVETDNDVIATNVTSSLNNLSDTLAAFNAWGFKEISSTLAPGLYRLDIDNAVFAAGALSAVVYPMITTSQAAAAPLQFNFDLTPKPVNVVQIDGDAPAAVNAKTFHTNSALAIRTAIGMAIANLNAQLLALKTAVNAGDVTTRPIDVDGITTGTAISGTYTDAATNNGTYWITAPVGVAVGGYGLRQLMEYHLPAGRSPTQLVLRGYWNGTGQTASVWGYNVNTGTYQQLNVMPSRTSDFDYLVAIPRDYAEFDAVNGWVAVKLEIRSTSTNTTHRMRADSALLYHISETAAVNITVPIPPTVQQIMAQLMLGDVGGLSESSAATYSLYTALMTILNSDTTTLAGKLTIKNSLGAIHKQLTLTTSVGANPVVGVSP